MGFEGSYVWQLRQVWGHKLLVGMGSEIIVTNPQGQVLLGLRVENGKWGGFGGHIDPGESLRACAVRELHEETGLGVAEKDLVPVGILSDPAKVNRVYPGGDEMQTMGLIFTVCLEAEPRALDGEYTNFGWFGLDNLPAEEMLDTFGRHALAMYKRWLKTKSFIVD